MAVINENYLKLKAGYLFPEITRRVNSFIEKNKEAKVIKLGIGDVTEPLPKAIVEAMHKAVDEMSLKDTFRGYGPEQGYDFLREAIAENDYKARGCNISSKEIFVSDGSKCDTGNILDILGHDNVIAVSDPVYPVYVDTNVMAGNTGLANEKSRYDKLVYLPAIEENNFSPAIPNKKVDIIYLCFPNNPTGATASKDYLTKWVNYAKENNSIILFDAAYEAFISESNIPHSIYEIEGAESVAIEFRSFSKNAGFTGTRCAFTVIPEALYGTDSNGEKVQIHKLWNRRHCTKFNGVSYIIQRAAEAAYCVAGKQQIGSLIDFYMNNARIIVENMSNLGFKVYGGVNAPYVWLKTPNAMDSWSFFDKLLNETNIVGTPGSGFGASGEGYFRISAFNSLENIEEAMNRINTMLKI